MTKLDRRAQTALNAALDRALDGFMVFRAWPDLQHFDDFYALSLALAKHDPWRSHFAVFDMFETLERLLRRYAVEAPQDTPVKLRDILSAERFAEFSRDVKTFLRSLPRKYEVWVELPSMPVWGAGEIPLTHSMTFVEREKPPLAGKRGSAKLALAHLLETTHEPEGLVWLRVLAAGYGGARSETTAMQDAISQMKQFFQLFRRLDIYLANSQSAFGGMLAPRQEMRCWIIDPEYPEEKMQVPLPERLKRFLSTAAINHTKLQTYDSSTGMLLTSKRREAKTREERVDVLKGKIDWITQLMDCPLDDWPDAHRIRTAVEWSFDSVENDNQTLCFIQACIGLEALLGDDDQKEPLTTRLADRCAYLLGKSHRDRDEIREKFTEVYKVRSKLVHGRSPRLSLPDMKQLASVQRMLEDVVTEEANRLLGALNKSKKTNQ